MTKPTPWDVGPSPAVKTAFRSPLVRLRLQVEPRRPVDRVEREQVVRQRPPVRLRHQGPLEPTGMDTTGRLDELTLLPRASVTLIFSLTGIVSAWSGRTTQPRSSCRRDRQPVTAPAVPMPADRCARAVGDAVAADRERIDDERRIERPITALGKRGPRRVDRAGDPRGIAAHGDGLRVVARLEEHDPRIGPARQRAQVEGGVAAQRDAAVGAAGPGIIAAGVDDHHPGAGDAGVAATPRSRRPR